MTSRELDVIRPTSPTPPGERLILDPLDRANLWLVLNGTWVFRGDLDPDRLRQGLADLLVHYPHLAGRVRRRREVILNDAGVPFAVESSPRESVDDIRADGTPVERFAPRLWPGPIGRGRQAPLAVKLTRLSDGWVLGLNCSHAMLDGQGFYRMVSDWGRVCAGRALEPPVIDRTLLPRTDERTKAEVRHDAAELGWARPSAGQILGMIWTMATLPLRRRVFGARFSPDRLARLKSDVAAEVGDDRISTNVALSAHLALMFARLFDHPPPTIFRQVTVIDGRKRIEELPATYAGNAAFPLVTATYDASSGLGAIASQIRHSLTPLVEVPSATLRAQVLLGREVAHHGLLMMPYDVGAMVRRRPTLAYINNFGKMPVYDLDFGSEDRPLRPVLAIPHRLPDQLLIWPAPPPEGGLDVYLTGPPCVAATRLAPDDPWWKALRLEGTP